MRVLHQWSSAVCGRLFGACWLFSTTSATETTTWRCPTFAWTMGSGTRWSWTALGGSSRSGWTEAGGSKRSRPRLDKVRRSWLTPPWWCWETPFPRDTTAALSVGGDPTILKIVWKKRLCLCPLSGGGGGSEEQTGKDLCRKCIIFSHHILDRLAFRCPATDCITELDWGTSSIKKVYSGSNQIKSIQWPCFGDTDAAMLEPDVDWKQWLLWGSVSMATPRTNQGAPHPFHLSVSYTNSVGRLGRWTWGAAVLDIFKNEGSQKHVSKSYQSQIGSSYQCRMTEWQLLLSL